MSRDLTVAVAACAIGLTGWTRLLTTRDVVERDVLRKVLKAATDVAVKRRDEEFKLLRATVRVAVWSEKG